MRRLSRFHVLVFLSAALAMAMTGVVGPFSAQANADSIACQEYSVPVTTPTPGKFMAGQLCIPAGGSNTVMVLGSVGECLKARIW
jgi:hypothetical protein